MQQCGMGSTWQQRVLLLAVMVFGPIFYIALPITIAILLGPVLLYWKTRNHAVTEEYKFHLGADTIKSAMADRKRLRANRQVTMAIEGKDGTVQVPAKEDSAFEIYVTAEDIISDAINHRASLLELKLTSKGCQGVYLVDGIPTAQEPALARNRSESIRLSKEISGNRSQRCAASPNRHI